MDFKDLDINGGRINIMNKYAYSIHDWEQGEVMLYFRLGGKIIGKVIVIAKSEKVARVKIEEYIVTLNNNNPLDKLYNGHKRYYATFSTLNILDILEEDNLKEVR